MTLIRQMFWDLDQWPTLPLNDTSAKIFFLEQVYGLTHKEAVQIWRIYEQAWLGLTHIKP